MGHYITEAQENELLTGGTISLYLKNIPLTGPISLRGNSNYLAYVSKSILSPDGVLICDIRLDDL